MFGAGSDFVFSPNLKVGDACPLVSPYTPLSKIMYVRSTFLLPAAIKCPAPIPNPSPSPPAATIVMSGFAIFAPCANVKTRPCKV